MRAQRSNPESFRGGSLDCFVARAPRNDVVERARDPSPIAALDSERGASIGSNQRLVLQSHFAVEP
ncbi:hypothetical protein EAS61_21185 [Bradyrhizobium zhanjiangense]|uniref:Uncharacterized protein n=1 Tax=Bradyrhizobium zhanjiangense TaxID=1325107 RepID=A0A4Q0QJ42_9BRAD|nr:hypothetical protein EAS61_21185 [Bradyrhizobium zhanjiangense]